MNYILQMNHAPIILVRMGEAVMLQTPGDSLASVLTILEVLDVMVKITQCISAKIKAYNFVLCKAFLMTCFYALLTLLPTT